MSGFKGAVDRANRKRYAWPEDFKTREQVAAELECEPDTVGSVLAPAISDGSVEMKWFKVWKDGRVVRMQGFRIVPKKTEGGKTEHGRGKRGT